MKFVDVKEPGIKKPIVIAAMQDMGNVGTIAIEFINKSLKTILFRYVSSYYPNYVVDKGGYIDFEQERWEYRYAKDTIIFGGGVGQPQTNKELYELCQDVIDIAKTHSAQLIYTVGAFHTNRNIGKQPKTFITTTSPHLTERLKKLSIETTPQSSLITGFNGLILGFAKLNNIQGIGLYSEINDPQIPQYHSAKSVLELLERLTYQKFGGFEELDIMADAVDDEIQKRTKSNHSWEES
ncbi:MAG TPA: PAC2 family protein [Nitrososphaeraceae archaeon]|nr:PAC2 family protein [Nitrososphaeraceae archaeon]